MKNNLKIRNLYDNICINKYKKCFKKHFKYKIAINENIEKDRFVEMLTNEIYIYYTKHNLYYEKKRIKYKIDTDLGLNFSSLNGICISLILGIITFGEKFSNYFALIAYSVTLIMLIFLVYLYFDKCINLSFMNLCSDILKEIENDEYIYDKKSKKIINKKL
ncbi:hypothetical protein Z959_08810 [Clostridium novyi B str. ATCC 27606]|uniref:Uncharacterized protein n=1 Tax=Clostridium novyi B str. ATCC 27606 TaxID=1443123 RepID=A0AA40IUY6_CLONO|nr:hypothetical protein [Clostridium novyi]KEI16918.1 hypothetical protein Z959_08810 [Clostridium novyi B str. ATCC 27606]